MTKPQPATGTISLDQPAPVHRGDTLTFTTTTTGLSGPEYPMVYVVVEVDGAVVYGRLDRPAASPPWVIAGGSSPWGDPSNPAYGKDGVGRAELWVYVPFRQQKPGNVYKVAETPAFPVIWE